MEITEKNSLCFIYGEKKYIYLDLIEKKLTAQPEIPSSQLEKIEKFICDNHFLLEIICYLVSLQIVPLIESPYQNLDLDQAWIIQQAKYILKASPFPEWRKKAHKLCLLFGVETRSSVGEIPNEDLISSTDEYYQILKDLNLKPYPRQELLHIDYIVNVINYLVDS